jgi:hypothetical protein
VSFPTTSGITTTVKARGLKLVQFYFDRSSKPNPSASTRCLPEI